MADGSTCNRPANRPSYGPHPDALLLKRRRWQQAEVAAKLAISLATPFGKDGRWTKGGNPNPNTRSRPYTCPTCNTTYPQHKGHVTKGSKSCRKCSAERRQKTCTACGTVFVNLVRNFKRGGKMRSTCHECAVKAAYAKVERRLARKGT